MNLMIVLLQKHYRNTDIVINNLPRHVNSDALSIFKKKRYVQRQLLINGPYPHPTNSLNHYFQMK